MTPPERGGDTMRVEVARAALAEAGRPDLAARVWPNRRDDPKIDKVGEHHELDEVDMALAVKAFRLGHLADPDGAPVLCGWTDRVALADVWMPRCDDCDCCS